MVALPQNGEKSVEAGCSSAPLPVTRVDLATATLTGQFTDG